MNKKLHLLIFSVFALTFSVFGQGNMEIYEKIIPNLKNASSITSFFELNDIKYYPEIVNDPLNALEYKGNQKVTANMGVYLGDMVYVFGTEGYKVGYKNYGAFMQLAKNEGLDKQLPNIVIERFESENVTMDSIAKMLDKALDSSGKYLTQKDKNEFFDFMVFGNYIEKLYITSTLLTYSEKSGLPKEVIANLNRNLLLLLAKQRKPLEELSKLMAGYSSNMVDQKEFQQLIMAYKTLESNKDAILKQPATEIYKAKEITEIQKVIKKIRERIIKV